MKNNRREDKNNGKFYMNSTKNREKLFSITASEPGYAI